MSELTKLRDRWIRHERLVAKLEVEIEQAMDDEVPVLTEKLVAAKDRLAAVIAATRVEEIRLLQPDSKLIFRPKRRPDKKPKPKTLAALRKRQAGEIAAFMEACEHRKLGSWYKYAWSGQSSWFGRRCRSCESMVVSEKRPADNVDTSSEYPILNAAANPGFSSTITTWFAPAEEVK